MKKDTYLKKMAELLGVEVSEDKIETYREEKEVKKKNNKFNAIREEEINSFRARQGLIYFFLAPELFSARVCKECGAPFLVSRHQVAYCSITCLNLWALNNFGFQWNRLNNIELAVKEVWEGNEPLWVNNLDAIQNVIDQARELDKPTDTKTTTE